jgi:hypothetical protein
VSEEAKATPDESVDRTRDGATSERKPSTKRKPAPEARRTEATSASSGPARSESWGFPRFATDFPRHDELDALVDAFARGDYATVRRDAPKLATATDDEAVKRAAQLLRERIEPDPTSRMLFVIAALLLVFLTAWWVTHDGAEGNTSPSPRAAPKVEHAD